MNFIVRGFCSVFSMIRANAMYFAWLIALIGFCISVLYGEILRNPPCPLCWYQRIALFPMVVLLGMAVYRGESTIVPYVFPLVGLGGFAALFHLLQPYVPFLQKASVCSLGVHCSQSAFTFFGVNGLSFLSVLGFVLIGFFLWIGRDKKLSYPKAD